MTNILARFTHQDETICYIEQDANRSYSVYLGNPSDTKRIFWHYHTKGEAINRSNQIIIAHLHEAYAN